MEPMNEMPKFDRKASTDYFDKDFGGNRPASLVAKSHFSTTEHWNSISTEDVKMDLLLAQLISRLSRPQNELLAKVIDSICQKVERETKEDMGGIVVEATMRTTLQRKYAEI